MDRRLRTGAGPGRGPALRRVLLFLLGALGLLASSMAGSAWGAEEDEVDRQFRVGIEAIEAAARAEGEARDGHLDRAIAAFRAILVDEPGLVRVRLELARAFFLKGEDRLARRYFEEVLAGEPPESVVINVQRFLAVVRARRRWDAHLNFALMPDSNLNAASSTRMVWLDTPFGRLPFERQGDIGRQSGLGFSVWGGGEYQYPLGPRLGLRAGGSTSVFDYKGRSFDRHVAGGHVGPRWLLDGRSEASLLATARRQWSRGRPETDRYGLRAEAERRLTRRLTLFGHADLAWRDCRGCDWLDGPVGEAGIGAGWTVLPTLRLGGDIGWSWSRAKAESWRSQGPQAGLSATLALPAGFTVGAQASVVRAAYRGEGFVHRTADRRPRRDRLRTLSVSVYNRAITLYGFSPRITFVNERRETNAQTLDYERNRGELSFVRQF